MTVSLYEDNGVKVDEKTYNSVNDVMADLDY
jgi:DNA-binding LacI/PurR family transcriptional regulator